MRDRALDELFALQFGYVSRHQVLGLGMSRSAVDRRLRRGDWIRVHPGIYRHVRTRPTWHGTAMLGVLATGGLDHGGVAGHRTAAALHRIRALDPDPVEIIVAYGRWRVIDGITIHQTTQLDRIDRTVIDGIPCTGLARTVLDLAAVLRENQLGWVIDGLLREQRLTLAELWDVLVRHSRRGRDGCGRLRQALEERSAPDPIALSDWSYQVARLLESAGLPRPRIEFRVHDERGNFLAQVDLAYPSVGLAIELDSVTWHADPASFDRDRRRIRLLAAAGWTVLPFTWTDYVDRPDQLTSQVAAILRPKSVA